ncbi:hypothetical protein [Lentzea sp. NEAU-D7]|uniref:hypothetical protein n=1 Tax=Lentzea sp. NEAU-D7 TaxID=2994667 RepID=UPI00224AABFD|nr:hypothetical protein [Lentzea sp. NEAU-D7]MCX2946957.1 hypothetical protein [Lentzea sp. NEAU-D7]
MASRVSTAPAPARHRARAGGAGRVLCTSHQGAAGDSPFAPMPDHAATEQHLAETGLPFTALRKGFCASTVPHPLGQALTTGGLVAPADEERAASLVRQGDARGPGRPVARHVPGLAPQRPGTGWRICCGARPPRCARSRRGVIPFSP